MAIFDIYIKEANDMNTNTQINTDISNLIDGKYPWYFIRIQNNYIESDPLPDNDDYTSIISLYGFTKEPYSWLGSSIINKLNKGIMTELYKKEVPGKIDSSMFRDDIKRYTELNKGAAYKASVE